MNVFLINLLVLIGFLFDSAIALKISIKYYRKNRFYPSDMMKRLEKKAATRESQWTEFSCCRRKIGIQTRQKTDNKRFVKIESRSCAWNYCTECADDFEYCNQLRDLQRACDLNSTFLGIMSRHCPDTCSWCTKLPTVNTPTPISSDFSGANQLRVFVFFDDSNPINHYKFATDAGSPTLPWKPISQSIYNGEVESFLLFRKPTWHFTLRIAFCTSKRNRVWIVTKGQCNGDWEEKMVLYAANVSLSSTEHLFVANRGRYPWSSRVYRGRPCCGYRSSIWDFYAPKFSQHLDSTVKPTKNPLVNISVDSTNSADVEMLKTEPTALLGTEPEEKECLRYHNYFRTVHKVPLLKLDAGLTVTAKRWANYLAEKAPTYPFVTDPALNRTTNWPHSDRGTYFREDGVGENIAWDLSLDGSTPIESVLRWYTEIFHYDRNNPLKIDARFPVGHFTQMIWKDSTHLGCGVAVSEVKRGPFIYKSTYTVAHYSPTGNLRYQLASQTAQSYSENVPAPKVGSCMSSVDCLNGEYGRSQCMGLSEEMSCQCIDVDESFGGRPRCYGSGGCIVSCKKPTGYGDHAHFQWVNECMGDWSCECILQPKASRAGALCT